MTKPQFLLGVPASHVLRRLAKAGGNEVESGKLSSPESSAALAINCFGWFVERPDLLPPLPGLESAGVPELVEVEFCARFPWAGGRHPWLDAVIQTPTTLIGIESKRFEPFRDLKSIKLSNAYDRPVWGDNMKRYEAMRDRLRVGEERFLHLDAAQLVKHAFGLVTEARRRGRAPTLYYLFAEPTERNGRAIALDDLARHRGEIGRFSQWVAGDEVRFLAGTYKGWLDMWRHLDGTIAAHGEAVMKTFKP